jgi:hypothetical protein
LIGSRRRESLAKLSELGNRRDVAACLEGLAAVFHGQGQPERAARLFGVAAAVREALGAPLPPVDQADHERHIAGGRAALGEEAFEVIWNEGRAISMEEAVAYALADADCVPPLGPLSCIAAGEFAMWDESSQRRFEQLREAKEQDSLSETEQAELATLIQER